MSIYKLSYKNTTFGNEYVDFIAAPVKIEDVHNYVFESIHRYNGNHALGHGKYEINLELYSNYPFEWINKKRNNLESQIKRLYKDIERLEDELGELSKMDVGIKIDGEDLFLHGGGISSKEEVLKGYCSGDEEEFNERYSKYYK